MSGKGATRRTNASAKQDTPPTKANSAAQAPTERPRSLELSAQIVMGGSKPVSGLAYPDGTIEKNRKAGYVSVLKTDRPGRSASAVVGLFAFLSFMATPAGLWCLLFSVHTCCAFVFSGMMPAPPALTNAKSWLITGDGPTTSPGNNTFWAFAALSPYIGAGSSTYSGAMELIRANPLATWVCTSLCTAVLSVGSFCIFARHWDWLYELNPGLRCQTKKTHDVVTHPLLGRSEVRLAFINLTMAAFLSSALVLAGLLGPDETGSSLHSVMGRSRMYMDVCTPTAVLPPAWLAASSSLDTVDSNGTDSGSWVWDSMAVAVGGGVSKPPTSSSSCFPAFLYLIISASAYFIFIDLWAYVVHRALHYPFLYRWVHKWHHEYRQPTAFSALGLHPFDIFCLQGGVYAFLFFVPLHPAGLAANLLYLHYHNVVDHSGVYCESWLPWQPSSLYHDDHHNYFHVNYGQSLTLWDRLGGTFYKEKKAYSETAFSDGN